MPSLVSVEEERTAMLVHPRVFERPDQRWFILHTLSNQEKVVANAMAGMDVAYFLPLRKVVKVRGGLRSELMTPLFPSYVFIRGSLDDVYRADRTKRIAAIVRVFDQAGLESEIRSIHLALQNQGAVSLHPYLKKGIRVEVREGPFRGMRGLIEDRTKDDRLILQVEVLGQATALEIDGSLLEPV